jgi:hypothetical protein
LVANGRRRRWRAATAWPQRRAILAPSRISLTGTARRCFGSAPLAIAESDYARRLDTWREWQPVAELAQGDN